VTGAPDAGFRHTLRVRYAETDTGGVAHHSSYVAWLEEARTEWMRARGKSYREVEAEGFFLVVAELRIRYLSPSRYDDPLEITVRVGERKRASLELCYEVLHARDGRRIATAMTRLACLDTGGQLRRLPDGV
jgi:acyl-CoA thioester hydrolase